MEVRPATEADVTDIRRIAERSWQWDYPEFVSRDTAQDTVDRWYEDGGIAAEIEWPDSVVLVAEDGDDVAGFVHGVYAEGKAYLLRVYVDPDHRGSGVATRLVEAATGRMFESGADRVRATVLATNDPGKQLYRSLGFERESGTYHREIGGDEYEEEVWVYDAPD